MKDDLLTMSNVLDALPYYDGEIERIGMRAKVKKELAIDDGSETRKANGQASGESSVAAHPLFVDRPDLYMQYESITGGKRIQGLEVDRYRLPAPSGDEGWEKALQNAESQLLHSSVRASNLDLSKKFGPNHWKLHNFQQEAFLRFYTRAADDEQSRTDSLNRERKSMQMHAGEQLSRLNNKWAELLNRSLTVELANSIAQSEIEDLESQSSALRKRLDGTGRRT